MGSSGPGRVRVERGIYRQPNGKYAVCRRHAGRLRFGTISFDLAEARRQRLALIAATCAGKVPVSPRLRFETVAGLRTARRAQRRRLAAASLPRPAPHLRQPPDHRPRARPSPGQPHARPRAHHDHARHLHAHLRGRPRHARHPHPHGRQPIRRPARTHHNRGRRHGAQAPTALAIRGATLMDAGLARRPRNVRGLGRRPPPNRDGRMRRDGGARQHPHRTPGPRPIRQRCEYCRDFRS
jgi:hypothetical protein